MKREFFCENWKFRREGRKDRVLRLPHDAMLEEIRTPDSPSKSAGGYYTGGFYTYTKEFTVSETWREKTVLLELEGVYPRAEVFCNEEEIGRCENGYLGEYFCLENLRYGEINRIEVRVDHSDVRDSRWYSGAGIYRPVWLWVGEKEHIHPEGIRVTTISASPAVIRVETKHTGKDLPHIEILEEGRVIASGEGNDSEFTLPNAKLWSAEHPHLYECRVSLSGGDTEAVPFGIRTIRWSSEGLKVNGENVLLKGGCVHHTNGILGAKTFPETERRKIRRLKEFGFNAIRSAHNPAGKDLLEACDELGMYVMDEGWDMWYQAKNPADYSNRFMNRYEEDIRGIVAKDYNHPSVIMYSIGNEVTEPRQEKGIALGKELVRLFHTEDTTRPVTAGINIALLTIAAMADRKAGNGENWKKERDGIESEMLQLDGMEQMSSEQFNNMIVGFGERMNAVPATVEADQISSPILDALDIAGYNYAATRYEMEKTHHPKRLLLGSETFPQDLPKNWSLVKELPYLIGDFMWTAWDYPGEAGIGSWNYYEDAKASNRPYPWLLADCGAIDILGNDNAEAGLAAVVWGARKNPYMAVVPVNRNPQALVKAPWRGTNAIPYWSWPGCEGKKASVEVYTDAAFTELFLNGKSLGRKSVGQYCSKYEALYEPGCLEAVSFDKEGKEVGRSKLLSAKGSCRIDIRPEGNLPETGGILYLDIVICGEDGRVVCSNDEHLTVQVEGGELLGFGSANPRTSESYVSGSFTTYFGRSQAVVRVIDTKLTVNVNGEHLLPVSKQFHLE